MPDDRLNRVQIAVGAETVVISWASRQALLGRLGHMPTAASVVNAFEAVGASRPVELTLEEEGELREVVNHWMNNVGADRLPSDVFALRNALYDHFDHLRHMSTD